MRMWLCNPEIMCKKHLCGEHVEMHMLLGTFRKEKQINGYIDNNLVEPKLLHDRHAQLAQEMLNRGYNHQSEICIEDCGCMGYLPEPVLNFKIDKTAALTELLSRCEACREREKSFHENSKR